MKHPNRIRERRRLLFLTQEQAAKVVGRTKSAWSHYECGHSEPLVSRAIAIARALETTVEDLFPKATGGKA